FAPFPGLDAVPFNAPYQKHLRAAGVKIILDGSPQGRTAWLTHPYHVVPDGRPADYAGYRQVPDDKLREMLRRAAVHQWQVFVHVNGDAAIQQLIDGVRAVDQEGGPQLRRTIAIHSQTARLDQLQAMKQLDIEPSFFGSHTYYWGDWHREVTLGEPRADRISPQRDAIDAGLRPTIHNDSPVVPPDMIRLIWSAATRRTRSNDILGPEERVTPYEALQEVTTNAAYEIHEEATKGTLEPGKLADLVVLDGDPLATPAEQLLSLHVVGTIKEGKYVFGAP
ncbi:MAG: amidohydrolase family protein, partial [Sphingomonadales bacterium]|nr:amidohydrolase family protein [Sphingomonadales bacterium]